MRATSASSRSRDDPCAHRPLVDVERARRVLARGPPRSRGGASSPRRGCGSASPRLDQLDALPHGGAAPVAHDLEVHPDGLAARRRARRRGRGPQGRRRAARGSSPVAGRAPAALSSGLERPERAPRLVGEQRRSDRGPAWRSPSRRNDERRSLLPPAHVGDERHGSHPSSTGRTIASSRPYFVTDSKRLNGPSMTMRCPSSVRCDAWQQAQELQPMEERARRAAGEAHAHVDRDAAPRGGGPPAPGRAPTRRRAPWERSRVERRRSVRAAQVGEQARRSTARGSTSRARAANARRGRRRDRSCSPGPRALARRLARVKSVAPDRLGVDVAVGASNVAAVRRRASRARPSAGSRAASTSTASNAAVSSSRVPPHEESTIRDEAPRRARCARARASSPRATRLELVAPPPRADEVSGKHRAPSGGRSCTSRSSRR